MAVDLDLQKLAGIDKLTFHANMFQIHGDGQAKRWTKSVGRPAGVRPA
ncbi:carbohydrate porin [Bradyrhizobium sp. LCT2]